LKDFSLKPFLLGIWIVFLLGIWIVYCQQ